MSLFRRQRQLADPGVIVVTADDHRCRPPGCHEWPAGEWYIDKPRKYPEGTVWRCPCGLAWKSGRYGEGFREGNGLWLNWWRSARHDAPASDMGGAEATNLHPKDS